MSMLRQLGICLVAVFAFAAELWSQESADELLARVRSNYLSKAHLEVTGYSRELLATPSQDAESALPSYRASRAEYGRLVITSRSPDHMRIVSQREQVSRGEVQPLRTLVFGQTGTGDSTVLVLNPSTKATSRITIPAGLFVQEINTRINHTTREDPLFRLLVAGEKNWATFFGQGSELRIEETEEIEGRRLVRIVSGWPSHTSIRLWVDPDALTLVRIVEMPGSDMGGMGMSIEVKETLYDHDFAKGAEDADFDLEAGWALAQPNISAAAGFSPSAELFATLTSGTIRPEAPSTRTSRIPRTPRPPAVTSPAPPPKSGGVAVAPSPSVPGVPAPTAQPPVAEIQSLTAEQMESIVLIEGDKGVGTGFVAKIRGVDFVVTNLHVIGGNEKVRVTTVRGVSIPVGAMFGALGRDIAILRIDGENKVPALTLAADPLKTAKLGDKVAVIGNRRGGAVATQVSGAVRGIGPDRLEVDAPFQPGNSGSPIVHVATGEVLGVASYSQTRKLDELDGPAAKSADASGKEAAKEEQRWFGFRTDEVAKWEAIDLARWRVQAQKIADFESDSEAIYYAMYGRFKEASGNTRVRRLIDRFDERANRVSGSGIALSQEVGEFLRSLRALADTGVKDLKTGDYYDFFRTNGYWETSITEQLRARADLASRLDKASENSSAFLSRLRR